MGEARRRKKLDPNYGEGKVLSLKTLGAHGKYMEEVLDDLHSECKSEMQTLMVAKKIPDDYQKIRDQLASWLENRISKYSDVEREMIAHYLLIFCDEISEDDNASPIMICFLDIIKSYLPLKLSKKIEDIIEDGLES